MMLTIGSLFSGIGGFDLAGEAMGWRTAWFVEWDASCQHWLGVNFPGVPIHGDITKLDFTELEPVDILCGGFPCQPASAAGKRLGTADDRWLWPHFARAIGALRPRYVVAENVPGLLSVNGGRAFAEVLRDLAALGYDAEWDGLSAGDVGSPQERERVWIVAYAGCGGDDERGHEREAGQAARQQPILANAAHRGANMGNGDSGRRGQHHAAVGADAEPGAGLVPLGDSTSGGRRTGARLAVRRSERGCASVGDPERTERRAAAEGRNEPDGHDAGRQEAPSRVGDGSEVVGNASSAGLEERDAAAIADGARHVAGECLGVGHTNGIGQRLRGQSQRAELEGACGSKPHRSGAAPWADAVPVRGADGTVRLIPREAAEQGPQSPLWPVADGVPGRVARLRAIGNAVVPQCVIEGPFRVIHERETKGAA